MSAGDVDAVVFDMDGVLTDTEQLWDVVRERLTVEWGGTYTARATRDMMGMSSTEWSRYMHEALGIPRSPEAIDAEVVRRLGELYDRELPLVPGAVAAARALHGDGLRLAVASSSNAPLIARVLDATGLAPLFSAAVSSEEVARGKPAPDVYLEAARQLGVPPSRCVAVEDSTNGLRAAHAAGMRVVAHPNRHFPPAPDALALAAAVVASMEELTPALVRGLAGRTGG